MPASLSDLSPPPIPWTRYLLFLAIATVGTGVDLWSKHAVFEWRGMPRPNNEWWLWEPYVGIETAINPGALFGMGDGYGRVFAGLSILAAVGILIAVFRFGAARELSITVSLGAILGGIFGNLYDRLGFWHPPGMPGAWRTEVRDWILFRYGEYTWPNFNIADCLLVTGAAILMWRTYWDGGDSSLAEQQEHEEQASRAAGDPSGEVSEKLSGNKPEKNPEKTSAKTSGKASAELDKKPEKVSVS